MSNDRSTSPISVPPPSGRQRRASLASGLSFTDYLSKSSNSTSHPTGAVASAVANAQSNQGRRLSITTLGLSGSPTQASSLGGRSLRQCSVPSSAGSNSAVFEDTAMEDSEIGPSSATPSSPFARRLSFGAQALRDVRAGSIGNGEGFNWSEALRSRAERAPSLGAISPSQQQHSAGIAQPSYHHQRAASIASMEQPSREMPKQPRQNKPDFFQEKILRGDFMD